MFVFVGDNLKRKVIRMIAFLNNRMIFLRVRAAETPGTLHFVTFISVNYSLYTDKTFYKTQTNRGQSRSTTVEYFRADARAEIAKSRKIAGRTNLSSVDHEPRLVLLRTGSRMRRASLKTIRRPIWMVRASCFIGSAPSH